MNIENFNLFGLKVTAQQLILASGLMILCFWIIKTRFGKNSLINSKPRRNNIPLALPVILWAIWITLLIGGGLLTDWIGRHAHLPAWQKELVEYIAMGSLELILIPAMLIAAWLFFARRLKGFGFEIKTIPADFVCACLNLWAVLPLVFGLVWLVVWIGTHLGGEQFQMQLNQGLQTILESQNLSVKATTFIVAVLIAPVCEEILFRGLLQSAIRKLAAGPWPGIFLTSVFFAMMHPWMHWPALFTLSVCLGYSYEKNGSLFRPIFIHMLFNLINILAALNQQAINAA
jgi:membrane protease YdiL (CAAX protease family)